MRKITQPLLLSVVAAALGLASVTAQAGTVADKLKKVNVSAVDSMIYLKFDKSVSNSPSCHASGEKRMVVPMSMTASKMLLATALTAVSSGHTVKLIGSNTCVNGVETVDEIMLLSQ